MLLTTQKISLDYYSNNIKTVRAKQYDKNTRQLQISITDNGKSVILDPISERAFFKVLTPDDRGVHNIATIQSDGTVLVELTDSILNVSGVAKAELNIYSTQSEKLLSTMEFNIHIEESVYPSDKSVDPDKYDTLTNLIAESSSIEHNVAMLENQVMQLDTDMRNNENIRNSNEEIRKTNEINRNAAEDKRQIDTASAIQSANNATTNANDSAQGADISREATELATENANKTIQEANSVIEEMKKLMSEEGILHRSDIGVANGVASLDDNAKIPSSQLPSYVDDVLEGLAQGKQEDPDTGSVSATGFILTGDTEECTPESDKIYIDTETNTTYRWGGNIYVAIGSSLGLGTTAATAFPGDRGLALEQRMSNIDKAESITFDNTDTSLLAANVQAAIVELTQTATMSKDGLMSATDKALVENYAGIQEIEATLDYTKWIRKNNVYVQLINISDIVKYNNCSIAISKEASYVQESQLVNADIQEIEYEESKGLIFTAYGVMPTVDIPIIISVGTSMNVVEAPFYLEDTTIEDAGIDITQAEYDKLTEKQKLSGTYWIIDAEETTTFEEVDNELNNIKTNIKSVQGKNIMPYPYYSGDQTASYGITYKVQPDGSVVAKGTKTENQVSKFYFVYNTIKNGTGGYKLEGGKTYTLSGCPKKGSQNTYRMQIVFYSDIDTNNVACQYCDYGDGVTFTVPHSAEYYTVIIELYGESSSYNLTFKPMLEEGLVAHSFEPVTQSNVTLRECISGSQGTNLISFPYYSVGSTTNGITFTVNDDGTVTANGTATNTAVFYLQYSTLLKKGVYTLSGCPINDQSYEANYPYQIDITETQGGAILYKDGGNGTTFTLESDYPNAQIRIRVANGETLDNVLFEPMLETGITSHSYEPTVNSNTSLQKAIYKGVYGSSTWDDKKSYTVKEYCIYNNVLYKCINSNANQCPPNDLYWEEVNLASLNDNLANNLVMEKYAGTNCTLFRVGNLVFLSINRNPNVKTLAQYTIIATKPQVPFELHWFQGQNTPLSWVTANNNQSGTITGYIQNEDVRIRNAITASDNIINMSGLLIGYVGTTI